MAIILMKAAQALSVSEVTIRAAPDGQCPVGHLYGQRCYVMPYSLYIE